MLEIPLSGIKKIEEVAKSNSKYISLSQGAIRVGGIPQQIKNHLQTLLKTDLTDYYESCWGLKPFREKLSYVLSKKHQTNISTNQILPTHGCIGGLSLLYLSILGPDDEVIIPEPSYPAYTILSKATRSKPVFVSIYKSTSNEKVAWELDIEKIKSATTPKTKIIIFPNPWNPLGIIIPKTTILELLEWCEKKGIYLVVDEAYKDYVFDGDYESVIPLVNQSEWIISANTFSKNMAMSGWRVGYLVIPQKINKALASMQDALLNCLNNTAQFAATYALDHPEFTEHFYKIIKHNRDLTMSLLLPLIENNIFSLSKPQGGFFAFLKTDQKNSTDLCMNILHQAKVSLIPGDSFGPSGASFLRLCYARDTDLLETAIKRIVNFFL